MRLAYLTKTAVALLIAISLPAAVAVVGAGEPEAAGSLVYTYDEMFGFDLETYLADNAPHLLPHAEAISHWAGYSSVSPRVLLALMDLKTGAVTGRIWSPLAEDRPFGDLSARVGVAEQVRDVADQLARIMYDPGRASIQSAEFGEAPAASPLHALLGRAPGQRSAAAAAVAGERAVKEFAAVYHSLFRGRFDPTRATASPAATAAGPPTSLLQFPFPRGATWHVAGAHTNTGTGSYPLSSIDMYRGGGWGSDQTRNWVSASAAGSFKRHSSCFAEVVHSGGWSTAYYHLMNIQYSTGASVRQNAAIANPAHTQSQALCNGGRSTGPHQHWSLKQNGSWYHLNDGVTVSGYRITATGTSYDTNCNRYYLTKNGQKYCAGWFTNP